MAKAKTIDLSKLDSAARKRVERVIAPRDSQLALLFVESDVARWEKAACKEGFENLTRWIESHLDDWTRTVAVPKAARTAAQQAAVKRDYPVHRRFNNAKIAEWKYAATIRHGLTLTDWVERCLNHEAKVK